MILDLEYTYDTRSPEERAPCRCAECAAAGECERRNVALVASLRKERDSLRAALEITEGTVRELRAWVEEAIPYVEMARHNINDEDERERVYELLTRTRP
jgi:hypothetical protein